MLTAVSLVMFFATGQQSEMAPQEYLKRNPWLVVVRCPLLYVLLALTLIVVPAGMRYSSRSRPGRALFIFTVGIVLTVLASAFFFLRAISTEFVGMGAAVTLLGAAMVIFAAGTAVEHASGTSDQSTTRFAWESSATGQDQMIMQTVDNLGSLCGNLHPDVPVQSGRGNDRNRNRRREIPARGANPHPGLRKPGRHHQPPHHRRVTVRRLPELDHAECQRASLGDRRDDPPVSSLISITTPVR